jgi:large subunit ribosomal protein L24
MKIIKGDTVKVLLGKDKGRDGVVIRSIPSKSQLVVKGLNLFKKHIKATQNQKGGIIEKERALLVSKVALICPECKKTARVGYKIDKSGVKSRFCKKCQAVLSNPVKK